MVSEPIDKRTCASLRSCVFRKACLADPAFHAKMLGRCSVLRLERDEFFYMGENVSKVLLHISEGMAAVTGRRAGDGVCLSVQYPGCTMNIPYAVSSIKPDNGFHPLTECYVVSIPFEGVIDAVPSNEEVTYALLDGLSENVYNLSRYAALVGTQKPADRIRGFLSYSRECCGETTGAFTLDLPQHSIAFATQLSRYSVSKALQELEKEGFLEVGYGSVTLLGD